MVCKRSVQLEARAETMTSHSQDPAGDLTGRQLAAQLGDQLARLLRAEVALARAELYASARQAVLGGGMLTVAAAAAFGGWLALIAAAIAAVAAGLPVWAAALIIGGTLMAGAGVLALLGVRRLARSAPPLHMTAGSIREEFKELAEKVHA